MSVRFGIYFVPDFIGIKITEDDLPAAVSGPADGSGQEVFCSKKGEPKGLPLFTLTRESIKPRTPLSARA
jgi:hypothetical protein